MAVAAVSRDTMRSFSPPAATPVTVSVTATLLLAAGGLSRTGQLRWWGRLWAGVRAVTWGGRYANPQHGCWGGRR